jgi:mono/diheme cytochrome c family protein
MFKKLQAIIVVLSLIQFGFIQLPDWVAPKSADNMVNPEKNNSDATKSGKKIFQQNCAICHGTKGKGDGVAGISLKPRPTNFKSEKVQAQSDGALFWKMSEGRAPMASYKAIFSETERWGLVNYLRTLK